MQFSRRHGSRERVMIAVITVWLERKLFRLTAQGALQQRTRKQEPAIDDLSDVAHDR